MLNLITTESYYNNFNLNHNPLLEIIPHNHLYLKLINVLYNDLGYTISKRCLLSEIPNIKGLKDTNLFVSTAYYSITTKKPRIEYQWALPIDIDFYKFPQFENFQPLNFINLLQEEIFNENLLPQPSYIEYSQGIRLVYVFDDLLCYRVQNHKGVWHNNLKAENLYKFISLSFQKIINNHFGFDIVDAQGCLRTCYVRVPYSWNKDRQVLITDFTKYYSPKELSEYAPDIVVSKDKNNSKISKIHTPNGLDLERLKFFEENVRNIQKGYRNEYLFCCFNWYLHLNQDIDLDTANNYLLSLNKKLLNPLTDNEVKHIVKSLHTTKKYYRLTNKNISERTGIEMSRTSKYYIPRHNKKDELDKLDKKVSQYLNSNLTEREIAKILDVSQPTVHRSIVRIRENA